MGWHTTRQVAAVVLAVTAAASPVGAQWARLPNGEWGYGFEYQGNFGIQCANLSNFVAAGACANGPGSVTLTNGGSSLVISVRPVARQVLTATNIAQQVTVGEIETRVVGGPFTLPNVFNTNVFSLLLSIDQARFGFRFTDPLSLAFNCCEGFRPFSIFPTMIPQPGTRYDGIVFERYGTLTIPRFEDATYAITAQIGLVPEPSTVALFGGGLFAVIVAARVRGRRPAAAPPPRA